MATKRQVENALRDIDANAFLEVEFTDYWTAEIQAPKGRYWNEGPHCLVQSVPRGLISKSEFWDDVLERLKGLESLACEDRDRPCEFTVAWGKCEYLV